jgi:hypothetical protein
MGLFDFFKKKVQETGVVRISSILCIPGFWDDTIEILPKTNGHFMVVGDVLMDVMNARHYKIELCEHDSKMRRSFEVAGMVTAVTDDFLNDIEKHKSVIYITGETGNFKDAKFIARAAVAIVNTGGIGVKVETTGKAFEKDKWIAFTTVGDDADMYELFVLDSLMMEDGTTYSCGMHNIGLRDSVISGLEFKEAQRVIRIFNYYQVIDKPTIKANQTFQTDINSPFYRITEELNQPYKGDKQFGNPFGMWRLTRQ